MDNKPAIKTFFEFLQDGCTVAQLATTVEHKGVDGWDRFGRFGSHARGSAGAMQALDALADFYDYDTRLREEDPSTDPNALDDLAEFPHAGVHRFGWLHGQLPEINRSETHPLPPRKARTSDPTKVNTVLGALLECLGDFRDSGKTMKIPSEDRFINAMLERFPHVRFVSRSTIQNEFATAKEIVRKAQQQAEGGG